MSHLGKLSPREKQIVEYVAIPGDDDEGDRPRPWTIANSSRMSSSQYNAEARSR